VAVNQSAQNANASKIWVPFAIVGALVVVASGLTLGGLSATVVILAIAAIQVAVVAGWMMHLASEGRAVTWTAALSAVLLAALFALAYAAFHDTIEGQERIAAPAAVDDGGAEER
jgi:caa(3)-type oxidase subunit IV